MSGKKLSSMDKSMRNVWNYKFAIALCGLILISGCYGQPLSTREKGTFAGAYWVPGRAP
jgi:hypothetical protein